VLLNFRWNDMAGNRVNPSTSNVSLSYRIKRNLSISSKTNGWTLSWRNVSKCLQYKLYQNQYSGSGVTGWRGFSLPFLAVTGAWGIHETFRLTSVSLSRTVGRTPWTSDQLIARLLPTQDNTDIE
jgi:hypothetical protein